jgi:hypothetical protein
LCDPPAGKTVSKAATKFRELAPGATLGVCGFDLEVERSVDAAEYESGRLFVSGGVAAAAAGSGGGRAVTVSAALSRSAASKPKSVVARTGDAAPPTTVCVCVCVCVCAVMGVQEAGSKTLGCILADEMGLGALLLS